MHRDFDLITTLELGAGELYPIDARRAAQLRSVYGDVWMTQAGELADVFLASGDEVALRSHRHSVIEALSPARVQIVGHCSARPTLAGRLAPLWRRALRAWRAWLPGRRCCAATAG